MSADLASLEVIGDLKFSEKARKLLIRELSEKSVRRLRQLCLGLVTDRIGADPKLLKEAKPYSRFLKTFIDYNNVTEPERRQKLLTTKLGLEFCSKILPKLIRHKVPVRRAPTEQQQQQQQVGRKNPNWNNNDEDDNNEEEENDDDNIEFGGRRNFDRFAPGYF
jgi:hypothetical protein